MTSKRHFFYFKIGSASSLPNPFHTKLPHCVCFALNWRHSNINRFGRRHKLHLATHAYLRSRQLNMLLLQLNCAPASMTTKKTTDRIASRNRMSVKYVEHRERLAIGIIHEKLRQGKANKFARSKFHLALQKGNKQHCCCYLTSRRMCMWSYVHWFANEYVKIQCYDRSKENWNENETEVENWQKWNRNQMRNCAPMTVSQSRVHFHRDVMKCIRCWLSQST